MTDGNVDLVRGERMMRSVGFFRSGWSRARVGALLLGWASLTGCRSPTEVTVVLSTDACDAGYKGTSITVASVTSPGAVFPASVAPGVETTSCGSDGGVRGQIGSVVVVPGSAGDGPFIVRVTAGLGGNTTADQCFGSMPPDTCIVATRELSFIPHTPLTLPIEMQHVCEGVRCKPGYTCIDGFCGSDQTVCGLAASCNVVDAGGGSAPPDAGVDTGRPHPVDAGHDAGVDSTVRMPGDASSQDAQHDTGRDDATDSGACPGQVLCRGTCMPSCTTTLASGLASPWAIAVGAGQVFWTSTTCSSPPCVATGTVMKIGTGLGGGTVTTLASEQQGPWALAVNSTSVFWTNLGSASGTAMSCTNGTDCAGSVVRTDIQGGGLSTIAPHEGTPRGLVLDGTNVYWVDETTDGPNNFAPSGSVMSMPLNGGADRKSVV